MQRFHVLLLERHAGLRGALAEALAAAGWVVTTAPSVEAALVLLRSLGAPQLPEVLLADSLDDGAVVAELRSDPARYAGVAVVAFRAGSGPVAGADAELRRPFSLSGLDWTLRRALARKGWLPAEGEARRG